MLTQDLLHNLFEYKDGLLIKKITTSSTAIAGTVCSNKDSKGYLRVGINKKRYAVHRVIFMMHHNFLPEYVDHIDGNKLNNKIENLRQVTVSQNQQNRSKTKFNTSGFKGVSLHKRDNLYRARITINKKEKTIGYFKNPEDAYMAYCNAAAKYHTHNPNAV
jgi:hypothetical protein